MKLSEMRTVFTNNIARLLTWADVIGLKLALDQVKRTQAEADANAATGTGISNSLHLIGLAADILQYDQDGHYLGDTASYKALGDHWKSLDPLNRWGGDFAKQDGNHFSMTYNGVQ